MKRTKPNTRVPNTALWRARRRCGLEMKQASRLLGHLQPNSIARYERGETEPSFDNAVMLSIIYGCELEDLFPHKYELFRRQVASRTVPVRNRSTPNTFPAGLFDRANNCTYENTLHDPSVSADFLPYVRDHVTRLARRLAGLS